MKTNYERALELLEESRYADPSSAALMVAQAQVFATLATVDAARDAGGKW